MTPSDTIHTPRAAVDMEMPLKWSAQPLEYKANIGVKNHGVVDLVLRALLFVICLATIIVVLTSKQSKTIEVAPGVSKSFDATWNQSTVCIYYVTALSVVCLYSILTSAASFLALKKAKGNSTKPQCYVVILDSLLFGIISSADGAIITIGYLGLKGNPRLRWNKICNVYGSFCESIAVSVFMSMISTAILLLLVWLSFYTLTKKTTRR